VPVSGPGVPRLYWKFNSSAYSVVTGSWIGGTKYQFAFGAGVLLGNTVTYFIVAQDTMAVPNVGSCPSSGASGFGVNPPSCSSPPADASSYTIVAGLSGIKNIPGDYSNLTGTTGLFADINTSVLTGNLTVNIVNDLYEPGTVALNEINTEDTSYHLNIYANTGAYRTVTGSYSGALIRFNGADGVSIHGNGKIVFVNSATSLSTVLSLTNCSNNNLIEGCKFACGSNASNSNVGILISGANSHNIIRNDTIIKTYSGIYIDGTYWDLSTGNSIYNNVIGSASAGNYIYQIGIYINYQDNLLLKGNEIFNIISIGSPKGIYAEALTNSVIEKNNLHDMVYSGPSGDGASGMTIKSFSLNPNVTIRNNLIRKISGMGSSPNVSDNNTIPAGIKLFGNANSGIYIYYNSIYMTPDPAYGLYYNNEWAAALEIGAGVSGITLENNILQNSLGERSSLSITTYGYAVYCKSTVSPFAAINNNIYFASNSDNNFVGLAGTASPPVNNMNLAAWKTFTGQDAQSINADPLFTSVINLTPQGSSQAIGTGLPLPGIVDEDYLSHARGNPSTIGAYELVEATHKTVNLTLFLEGLYAGSGLMHSAKGDNGPNWGTGIADQITVELHSSTPGNYANKLYTATSINLSTSGVAQCTIPAALNGTYYITVKHRNSVQTVSSVPVSFSGTSINHDFSANASNAYGSNLKDLGSGKYGIYTGDTNGDGGVNTLDLIDIETNANSFISGYATPDLNGDGIVDILDIIIADTNAAAFISAKTP
jgi:hypothetical protein